MSSVVMSIPRLGVKKGGSERNKEIYVMSFSSDLRAVNGPKLTDIIAAHNETLPNIVPAIASQALLKFVLMTVSNVFRRIRPDQPVSMSGSGILLYPNLDPKGMIANHFVVMEDDEGTRNLGKLLENLFGNESVKGLVDLLKQGVTQPALAALLGAITSALPEILKKNKDDFLFAHSHSGFHFDNYGVGPGETSKDFKLENDRVFCSLRILVLE